MYFPNLYFPNQYYPDQYFPSGESTPPDPEGELGDGFRYCYNYRYW